MHGLGRKVIRVFLLVSALVAVGIVTWLITGSATTPRDEPSMSAAVGPAIQRSEDAEPPASAATARDTRASEASAPRPSPGIADGMTTQETYAFVVEQHRRRQRGSFAVATYVQDACRAGMGALLRYRDRSSPEAIQRRLQRSTGSVEQGEALQARYAQQMEARCRQVAADDAIDTPLAGDTDGEKLHDVRRKGMTPQRSIEAFLLLAQQGQLAAGREWLMFWPYFEGQLFKSGDDVDVYIAAMNVAAFRATADPARADTDLRLMAGCLSYGVCDGRIESIWFGGWPEGSDRRLRAESLAERLTRALARNDLPSFLPPLSNGKKWADVLERP